MKVIEGEKGLIVSLPGRQKDGSFRNILYPLNADTRKMIEDSIISKYNKAVKSGFSTEADE